MSSVARRPRAEAKARTREALLASAAVLFEEQGYVATTVDAVAARAGFTKGAFYAHFPDKAEVLNVLLDESTDERFAQLERDLAAAEAGELFGVLLRWVDATTHNPPFERAQGEFYSTAISDPEQRRRLAARVGRIRDAVTKMIDAYCRTAGVDLPVPGETFATMVMAYIEGATRMLRIAVPELPAGFVATGLTCLWQGVFASSG